MKRQDTLIRLRKFRVDELQRRMASINAMQTDVEKKITDLEESVTREKQRAADSDIGRLAFPSFLRAIDIRRANLNNTLQEIDRERAACQDELTDAYQDLKSLQFAYEQQEKRMAEAENRRAQGRLDEMALVRHLRKHPARSNRDQV